MQIKITIEVDKCDNRILNNILAHFDSKIHNFILSRDNEEFYNIDEKIFGRQCNLDIVVSEINV